jgi:radical SAM protein with 4Fe4S-binding SPASM domain
MYEILSAPMLINWEVTQFCNHSCLHCYNHWRTSFIKERINKKYKQIYENATNEFIENKVFVVTVTGGEPLTVFKEILPFIKKLNSAGIWVTLNSNLTLLTSKRAKQLKEAGIRSFLVSLPSADPETCDFITGVKNSFNSTVRGIKIAQEENFPIFINMVVSKINKDQVGMTAEFVSSLKLKHFAATRASEPSSKKEFSRYVIGHRDFRKMQEDLEKIKDDFGLKIDSLEANPVCSYGDIKPSQGYRFCNAGRNVCTVGSEGEIRPCNRISRSYGNISEGLRNSWLKMEDWRSDKLIPSECSECKLKYICRGGCKADAMIAFNDFKKPDPLCDFKYLVKEDIFRHEEVVLTSKSEFKVNPELKIRYENFGSILFISLKNWVPVSQELSGLFSKKEENVSIKEIEEALDVDNKEALSTATFLLNKKVLL